MTANVLCQHYMYIKYLNAGLLECAGVDAIAELAQPNAANLGAKMVELNEKKNLVRKVPTQSQVEDWVVQTGERPKLVTH
ncbi:MAG: hypothetical protein ACI8QT_001791 [Halioglobus sp.]|jgi:hypothetical protein